MVVDTLTQVNYDNLEEKPHLVTFCLLQDRSRRMRMVIFIVIIVIYFDLKA